ncbi:MAG: malto-oligosyltrehalose trehalohydrolase [Sumerlaeia bacterium]
MIPGAHPLSHQTRFLLWAPKLRRPRLHLVAPEDRIVEMTPAAHGYWEAAVEGIGPGARYFFQTDDGDDRPDPASRFQPEGPHGPSEVVAHGAFDWTDAGWSGLPMEQTVLYELHIGTFTAEGTFDAAIAKLDHLTDIGVNAIEIMPVAQFPGSRNWGYDGTYPYAPQNSYGGPDGLKRLVDACHRRGIAVYLDVVYNHFGPEGNYTGLFAPYSAEKYKTPWGAAMNFDGEDSDPVRTFFIENALMWLRDYHVDGLRLDATHAIYDTSARPFLRQLAEAVRELSQATGWTRHLIAESDANDPKLCSPAKAGGYGLSGQWVDDFHHVVHTVLTSENEGYYCDYGSPDQLQTVLTQAYVFDGRWSPFRKRTHGMPPTALAPRQMCVCIQNHDQVGNRGLGERQSALMDFESQKLAAGLLLLSPWMPMLFMGEEWGETNPFQFFTSHGDDWLVEAVRKGRREEFASFDWGGDVPDPQSEATFERSKLDWDKRENGRHGQMLALYKALISLRRGEAALGIPASKSAIEVRRDGDVFLMSRHAGEAEFLAAFNIGQEDQPALTGMQFDLVLDSASPFFGGDRDEDDQRLSRRSFHLYRRTGAPRSTEAASFVMP